MKLDPDAEHFADAYYWKRAREIHEDTENRVKTRNFVSFQETAQADYSIRMEAAAEMAKARLESYVMAFEKAGVLIDEEDRNEILTGMNKIIESQRNRIFSGSQGMITMARNQLPEEHRTQMKEYFVNKARQLAEPAVSDFLLKISEMKLNSKYPQPKNEPNSIHINTNYGNFQQGGSNNIQMNQEELQEKDRRRLEVLRWIYDEYDRTKNIFVHLDKMIPDNLGSIVTEARKRELSEIIDFLSGEGLVERKTKSGFLVTITHWGKKESESSIRNPNMPTDHFSVPVIREVNNHFYGTVGAVQQGDNNTANVQQNFSSEIEETKELLAQLREYIIDDKRPEGLEYIEGLEAEVMSEKPSESRMKLFLQGLSGVVKDAGKELIVELGKKVITGEINLG